MFSRPGENYEEHIQRIKNSYMILKNYKKLDNVLNNILNKLLEEEGMPDIKKIIIELFEEAIFKHDLGKQNKYFQRSITKNGEYNDINKEHSIISSYYYLEFALDNIENYSEFENLSKKEIRNIKRFIKNLAMAFSFVISKHHGIMSDYKKQDFINKIRERNKAYPDTFFNGFDSKVLGSYEKSSYEFKSRYTYYLTRYLFGLLCACDYMAVHEFFEEVPLKINNIDNNLMECFKSSFEETKTVKKIRNYENGSPLSGVNMYRSKMFLEAERNLKCNYDSYMYYLEAPTGSGKSITSLNSSLHLLGNKHNKIYYIAPFTNIIEQTYKDVVESIGQRNKDIIKLSYKEEIVSDEEEENYSMDYMDSIFLNYPYSIITHVKLFSIFFGNRRGDAMMLPFLSNSIIILDEIQSYKNEIWIEIINTLRDYAKILNLKIIIMSATLPKMDELIFQKDFNIIDLVTERDFYFDFFKKRVEADFTLLDLENNNNEKTLDALFDKIKEYVIKGNTIQIGTITKKSCDLLFKQCIERYTSYGYTIFKIDSSVSTFKKDYIISKIKSGEKIILVATQSAEAGLDIDMDIGFKNIGILDGDEQFCGRIQRNFREKGIVYFFKLDEVKSVYGNDYRAEKTLEDKELRELLKNKNFDELYKRVYKWLLKYKEVEYLNLIKDMSNLSFDTVRRKMKLIDDSKETVLLVCKFKKPDESIVDLEFELEKYEKILESGLSYSEKSIKLSRFRQTFDLFSYSFTQDIFSKIKVDKEIRGLKIVLNAERFFTNTTKEGYITIGSDLDIDKLIEGN